MSETSKSTARSGENAAMFDSIARTYDLLNRVLSMNTDAGWREKAACAAGIGPGDLVLDVCTGTADLAIECACAGAGMVAGADLSMGMLSRGRTKIAEAGLDGKIALACADALRLPFRDSTFDAVTMGFGLRNLADRARGLEEAARVVNAGGRVVVLEFVKPPRGLFGKIFRTYLDRLLPVVGGLVSGQPKAYRFLADSIDAFLEAGEIAALMEKCGCARVSATPLFGGIAGIFTGLKS